MRTSGLGRLVRDQQGFTAVELIVTVALSSLVMLSIFPLFSLINGVYVSWQGNAESRAVGQSAAVILGRDLRADAVVSAKMQANQLVLQTAPNPPTGAAAGTQDGLCITYTIGTVNSEPALVREVLDNKGNLTSTVVAHGVNQFLPSFVPSNVSNATIEVNLQLATIPPTQPSSQVSVPLWFSTRLPPSAWTPTC